MNQKPKYSQTSSCCLECGMVARLVLGAWKDVRTKAKRLRDEGKISNIAHSKDIVTGVVQGDNGTYSVVLYRQSPGSSKLSMWECDCKWGEWAFKRQHTYVGRTCSHALALLYEAFSRDYKDPKDFATSEGM